MLEDLLGLFAAAIAVGLAVHEARAEPVTYYVAANGSDANDGTSPERPWRTLDRVNAAALAPGDSVLFRRGDTWRGSLRPRSGDEHAVITYGAYGEGPKPVLMGSVSMSDPEDWRHVEGALWVAGTPPSQEPSQLPADASNASPPLCWGLYCEHGASAQLTPDPVDPCALRLDCAQPGIAGPDIQLIATGLQLRAGHAYRLSFRARSSARFWLHMPPLMMAGPPWSSYSTGPSLGKRRIGPEWKACVQTYLANTTTDNGRLTFYLGTALPPGATLWLDSLTWSECPLDDLPSESPQALTVDVGNIILGDEQGCAIKVWEKEQLREQGQFWYDEENQLLYFYSDVNPAVRYGKLECALHRHIIDQSGVCYVTYEHLALKYGGAHGIGGGNTHHITVRDCDLSFIGGADQYGGDRTIRYGNGIEFWGNAHHNLVERCRIWEIYDAALTNQSAGATVQQHHIIYRNNVIWNCEYSFEYWNRPETSETYDIFFLNNTCVGAGRGWGHTQRPDPSGRHLCFYVSDAQARNISIRNNIFCDAVTNAFYAPAWTAQGVAALQMDHNLWYQPQGHMIALAGQAYAMSQFARYQSDWGLEPHSLVGQPLFLDADGRDFRLAANSPGIDAGEDVGITADCVGTPVPQGAAPDIGAYELVPSQ